MMDLLKWEHNPETAFNEVRKLVAEEVHMFGSGRVASSVDVFVILVVKPWKGNSVGGDPPGLSICGAAQRLGDQRCLVWRTGRNALGTDKQMSPKRGRRRDFRQGFN